MHVIISSENKDRENILMEISPSMAVQDLRASVAAMFGVANSAVRMQCDGVTLDDGAEVSDFYVTHLSTIRVSVSSAPASMLASVALSPPSTAASGSPPPVATVASRSADEVLSAADAINQVLSEAEMRQAVIVMGIPAADAVATEKALFDAFSKFGLMRRVIFQDENADITGATQRAIIIFDNAEAAEAAAHAPTTLSILGSVPSAVFLATGLDANVRSPSGDAPVAAGAVAPGRGGQRINVVPRAVGHLLAQGYLYGQRGVVHVKHFGEEHGVNQRINIIVDRILDTAGELNARYRIIPTIQSTYEAASVQAADLDRELHITEKLNAASRYALARASEWTAIAMQNPTIASTVSSASGLLKEATATLQETWRQATAEVRAATPRSNTAPAASAPRAS